jgi:uncharacterized protein with HEPN domain
MLDATTEALEFVQGMQRADLDRNRMLVLSLVKELEIIGEAASKVSAELRSQHGVIQSFGNLGRRSNRALTMA